MTRHEEMRREAWIQGYQLNNHSGAKALERFDADFPVDPDAKPLPVAEKQSESGHSFDDLEGGTLCLNGVTFYITEVSTWGSSKYGIDLTLELMERRES